MTTPELPLAGCGCCEPAVAPAPASVENRPGASSLNYRVGTYAGFLEAMRMGAAAQPALRGLRTREPDDPAAALLDAWAATLDVLTFYTERIANEGYLRTATELTSLIELARTVGYERGPGRASETVLAFTLEDGPGSPIEVTVPAGTKVASVPGPGETPQTFETIADLVARPERNAVPAQISAPTPPVVGATSLFLAGAATGLRPGDQILITGRDDSPGTDEWLLRSVRRAAVTGLAGSEVTEVVWDEPLGEGRSGEQIPAPEDVRVYALRLRTSLFGANAPDWRALPDTVQEHYEGNIFTTGGGGKKAFAAAPASGGPKGDVLIGQFELDGPDDWPHFTVVPQGAAPNTVDLDGDHPQVRPDGWLVLQRATTVELYAVSSVAALTRSDYAISGKVTRVTLTGGPSVSTTFAGGLRTTIALANSERLELAEAPIIEPVQGRTIRLAEPLEPALPVGHSVVVIGPRPRLVVADDVHTLVLVLPTGASLPLHPGQELLATAPATAPGNNGSRTWTARRLVDGAEGTVAAGVGSLLVTPADPDDEVLAEQAAVAEPPAGASPSDIHLTTDLAGIYDRAALRLLANVAAASHGETRSEILGSGDAAVAFPRFRLAQSPLTYRVGAGGSFSTLEVRIDGVRWDEVTTLAPAGPRDRVYTTHADDEGTVTVTFGDGSHGARLPTGRENVSATYRVGTGLVGVLPAGRLTMLLTRPLGVRSVTNPFATGIAADPDPADALRRNAPRTALTFDRVVSLTDFADFARGIPGIAKASATWTWQGEARVVNLVVAGDGAQLVDATALADLATAIRTAGDPRQPLEVVPATVATFDVDATLVVDPKLVPGTVQQACLAAFGTDFGFDARELGQPVTASEVVASAHRVPGVVAVTLSLLRRTGAGGTAVETVIVAGPAEVLTIRPEGISLIEATP